MSPAHINNAMQGNPPWDNAAASSRLAFNRVLRREHFTDEQVQSAWAWFALGWVAAYQRPQEVAK